MGLARQDLFGEDGADMKNPRVRHWIFSTMILLSAVSLPLTALLAGGIARVASQGFVAYHGGRPMPALTQVLVTNQSGSNAPAVCATLFALAMAVVGIQSLRDPESGHGSDRLVHAFLCFIGPTLSLMYLVLVLLAIAMPLVSKGTVMVPLQVEP